MLISYIDTAGSTMTRQKALKEQYLFTCTCRRCVKLVCIAKILELMISYTENFFLVFHLFNFGGTLLKGEFEDIQESAVLEGYRCKNDKCDGFLLRDPGMTVLLHMECQICVCATYTHMLRKKDLSDY